MNGGISDLSGLRRYEREQALRPWGLFDEVGPMDCWMWRGRIDAGYGRWGHTLVHRLFYEAMVGPIPEGLHIDHLCEEKLCVNPGHLEAVTPWENTLRTDNPVSANARKTHCDRGHPLSGDNLYITPIGNRACKTCRVMAKRRYRARLKAEGLPCR